MDKQKVRSTNRKLRMLVLSHISEFVGGAEKSLVDVFDLWVEKYDIEPEFIMRKPEGSLAKEMQSRGWKYHVLDYTFWSVAEPPVTSEEVFKHASKNLKAIREIEKIIQASRPDAVVTNTVVSPWAALAAHNLGYPHIWFVREYGDLDHGRVFEIGRQKTLEDVGNLSDIIVANSFAIKNHLSEYVEPSKITVLYNPFDAEALRSKAKEKAPNPFKRSNSLKLVITGSLTPSKGQLYAVEAAGKLTQKGYDIELCVIGGNGPKDYRHEIDEAIQKYGIFESVHLIGHQTNPMKYVSLADVGIMASRMEAFGRVTFEYLLLGKPCVGSKSGGTIELIDDKKTGYLFDPENSDSLAKVLENYVKNPTLVEKHRTAALKKADEVLNTPYSADALYKKIIALVRVKVKMSKKAARIHFKDHYIDYVLAAEDYINRSKTVSVKALAKQRAKARAKHVYRKTRHHARRVIKG